MLVGRKRLSRAFATLSIVTLGGTLLVAAPSSAAPDVEDVSTRVDRLYHEAEQASERYNGVRLELDRARHRLARLRGDLAEQRERVAIAREQVVGSVVSQYQGQAIDTAGRLLLAEDPDAFLDQLTTVAAFHDQRAQAMAGFSTQARRLAVREHAADREVATISRSKSRLGAEKAEVDAKAARAKALLTTLKERAARRAEARASRSADRAAAPAAGAASTATRTPAAPATAPASGGAAAAVRYAMAQVGKTYVYGAAGPNAFDCSGLTMMAWKQGGVNLPHFSGAQLSSGTRVSESALRPGDLVFYYSPVSHVGMYIGNGRVVNALNPRTGIQVSGLHDMPYAGAVRPS